MIGKPQSNYKLNFDYYQSDKILELAKSFLGMHLCTNFNGHLTIGKIVEVEAYSGAVDKASHAYPNKITPRTKTMFMAGGIAYVYLVYGMHHLFNIVTNSEGSADAILIRAVEPIDGLAIMQERRNMLVNNKLLTGGPARLAQALGINTSYDGLSLLEDKIWISIGEEVEADNIIAATRIGVEYAAEDALLPWRFYIKGNKYVSK